MPPSLASTKNGDGLRDRTPEMGSVNKTTREYIMTEIDIEKIKRELERQRTDLIKQIDNERKRLTSSDVVNPDRSDLAYEYLNQERRTTLLNQLEDHLAQTEEAIERIENNEYGTCQNCGNQISPQRLAALPTARLCMECQQKA